MESYLGNPNLKKANQPKEWSQAEIEEYQLQTQSGTWVRASMLFALLFIITWGL